MMSEFGFLSQILSVEGVEYAIFDANGRLSRHSEQLGRLVLTSGQELAGIRLQELIPELVGYDDVLEYIRRGLQTRLRLEFIARPQENGGDAYLHLQVSRWEEGWLLTIREVTQEGEMHQRMMQQRNELSLLARDLNQARSHLDDLLRRYVSPAAVDQILSHLEAEQPGGQRREITVMFADLRGFTGWAEQQDPELVMAYLNCVLGGAVEILLEHGATLDKFMGDAVMAFFNAPGTQVDHARLAVTSALKLRDLKDLQGEPVTFGIGIHTGWAVVGNLGTLKAMNYTALGDAVNTAKRLEENAAKGQILISAGTQAKLAGEFRCVSRGFQTLKGRAETIEVFDVI